MVHLVLRLQTAALLCREEVVVLVGVVALVGDEEGHSAAAEI